MRDACLPEVSIEEEEVDQRVAKRQVGITMILQRRRIESGNEVYYTNY